jgi:glycosyltransferase involved in cell wall biosynthesis
VFSVIVPVYNRDPTASLKSVQAQTFRDFECIVVDDGSASGAEIEAAVEALNDNRFRYVRQPNMGANAARNRGIDEAKQPFVAFLDSDDLWLAKKLSIQAIQLEHFPERVVYTKCLVDRGVGKLWERPTRFMSLDDDVAKYLFVQQQFIPTSTICLARSIAAWVRWDETLIARQDFDFCLRLREKGLMFDFMPEPLVIWRDVTDHGRTSYNGGLAASLRLLEKNAHCMSWRARLGYRANVLAYDLARESPLLAVRDLLGGLVAGVSPIVVGRQFLRAFMPRRAYRGLVNSFVSLAGRQGLS